MKVPISRGRQRGHVQYDPETQDLEVRFPDEEAQVATEVYLTTPRIYRIPKSQQLDDYREELAMPIDSLMHMELALSTLRANTGLHVHWNKEEA